MPLSQLVPKMRGFLPKNKTKKPLKSLSKETPAKSCSSTRTQSLVYRKNSRRTPSILRPPSKVALRKRETICSFQRYWQQTPTLTLAQVKFRAQSTLISKLRPSSFLRKLPQKSLSRFGGLNKLWSLKNIRRHQRTWWKSELPVS